MMKSEHRHDLETNELARRLATWIEFLKPYAGMIVTVALIAVAVAAGLTYVKNSLAARQSEAWDNYNLAVQGRTPDLEMLKQSAEQHAGTPMAQWANVTWADGQLRMAALQFMSFRDASNESLAKAESAYQTLLNSSADRRIRDRANFGLGRVYELRNNLAKAREHYEAVTGGFAEVARSRAEELADESTIVACDWLATAQPPPPAAATGPGQPGVKPEFEVSDFGLPGDALPAESLSGDTADDTALEDILKGFNPSGAAATEENRYEPVTEEDTGEQADNTDDAQDALPQEDDAATDGSGDNPSSPTE